jgi:MOSC domain-containing protein YiiM
VSVSNGGVPKLAVESAEVSASGVSGDRQRDRRNHGGPERAVCLFALENIEAMQSEGHLIFPGSTGENITTSGLDWNLVVPGARLRVGETLLLEVTRYTTPCVNIQPSFADGDITRMSHLLHPDNSRVYARVLEPGPVRAGDLIELLPVPVA